VRSAEDIPFIGGHVALDFVNTAEERSNPAATDYLETAGDLRVWGERYGLLSADAAAANDSGEFERTIAARELLYDLFLGNARGAQPDPAQLARLGQLAAEAYAAGRLEAYDGHVVWRWSANDLASIRHTAVAQAVELLRDAPGPRLKQCPGEHCGWFFLDTSKPGNRRWCSMDECGQDAKDAQRRARRQAARRFREP
jgi:predicted RNA-binding Zn ribbon-like protein